MNDQLLSCTSSIKFEIQFSLKHNYLKYFVNWEKANWEYLHLQFCLKCLFVLFRITIRYVYKILIKMWIINKNYVSNQMLELCILPTVIMIIDYNQLDLGQVHGYHNIYVWMIELCLSIVFNLYYITIFTKFNQVERFPSMQLVQINLLCVPSLHKHTNRHTYYCMCRKMSSHQHKVTTQFWLVKYTFFNIHKHKDNFLTYITD